jgi:hypothetical protein
MGKWENARLPIKKRVAMIIHQSIAIVIILVYILVNELVNLLMN